MKNVFNGSKSILLARKNVIKSKSKYRMDSDQLKVCKSKYPIEFEWLKLFSSDFNHYIHIHTYIHVCIYMCVLGGITQSQNIDFKYSPTSIQLLV